MNSENKNAFQYDAYRPLVARISQHAPHRGGCIFKTFTFANSESKGLEETIFQSFAFRQCE